MGIVWTPSPEFRWLEPALGKRWAPKILQQKWNGLEHKTEGCEVKAISHVQWRDIPVEKERSGIKSEALVFP